MPLLLYLINVAINVLIVLIIVHAILSWIPEARWRYRQITRPIDQIAEPLLEPFRRIVPPSKTGGIDISPALAIVALAIIRRILISLLAGHGRWI